MLNPPLSPSLITSLALVTTSLKFIYPKFLVMDSSRGKGVLDELADISSRKSPKVIDCITREDIVVDKSDIGGSNEQSDPSCLITREDTVVDNSDIGGSNEQSDPSCLIYPIGRDNSISCLLRVPRSDYGSLAMVNQNFRSLLQSGDLYKMRRQMGIIECWVYFSCNLPEWEAYDPIRHRWMHLPRIPCNDCFMLSDKESLAVGTELLVFGRDIFSLVIYRFSLLSNSWSQGTEMNSPRCLFASASLGEIAIVAGGCDLRGSIMSSAELYNSDTRVWAPIPSMHKARKMCSGVFMDGKFYAVGGIGIHNSESLTCGEMFDLKTQTWTLIPNMLPKPEDGETNASSMKAPPLLAVVKNELYGAYYERKEVRKYDKLKNEWTTVARLPDRAMSMNGWGIAFRGCGDSLIVIGGPRTEGNGVVEINAWAPDQDPPEWRVLASKQASPFVFNCAVMGC